MDFVVGIILSFVCPVMSMSQWRRCKQLLTCSVAMVFISIAFDVRFVELSMTWELHISAWTNGGGKKACQHNECWKVNSRIECALLSFPILLPVTLSIGGPIRPLISSLTECFPHSRGVLTCAWLCDPNPGASATVYLKKTRQESYI